MQTDIHTFESTEQYKTLHTAQCPYYPCPRDITQDRLNKEFKYRFRAREEALIINNVQLR